MDVFVAERASVTDTTPPGTFGQTAGFRFVTYSPDVAVIQFVSRFADGTLQVTTSTVRWVNGDWKLQLQPDGSESHRAGGRKSGRLRPVGRFLVAGPCNLPIIGRICHIAW